MSIYKIEPVVKDYLWGGTDLKTVYNKQSDKNIIAESWELSFHKDGLSKIKDSPKAGYNLKDVFNKKDFGTNCENFTEFPVLVKLINAKDNLSVQVHPSDDYALKNENSFGKTEMWYILNAEKGSGIYCGFKENISKQDFSKRIENNTLLEVLNFYEVKEGDVFFIESGTVHAIGKGTTICEVQQNSNLTYRVYDYDRVGQDGKKRELHIEKAKIVSNTNKFENNNKPANLNETLKRLSYCKYFTVYEKILNGEDVLEVDEKSFVTLTVIKGKLNIEDMIVNLGETIIISAENKKYKIKGECKFIMTKIVKYYVGIDIGGTRIKGGITDEKGNILISQSIETLSEKGSDAAINQVKILIENLLKKAGLTMSDIEGIGMGIPGMINSKEGIVTYSNNLAWRDVKIVEKLKESWNKEIKITNDANAAAIGEIKFGLDEKCDDAVMITLGTGVGSGIFVNGLLLEGNKSAGAEIGHSVIHVGGEQCTCGRKGCFEVYSSATALIRDTKRAMEKDKKSKMWQTVENIEEVSGKTAFDCQNIDKTANEVVDNYLNNLAEGLANIVNIFRPVYIILGGGVCAQGDNLLKPLQARLNSKIYGSELGPKVELRIAKLGNNAGFLGGIALFL